MKVLHVLTWYPTADQPHMGVWIQRHVDALAPHVAQEVVHVPKFSGPWRLQEVKAYRWLKRTLKGYKADVLNVHIAYPLLVHAHLLPAYWRERLVITEHWSIYHHRFYTTKKLPRIQAIFGRGWPVITVSDRLAADIAAFSGHALEQYTVPNVVDTAVFHPSTTREKRLVLGSYWKLPKDPLALVPALDAFLTAHPDWSVDVFGYGPLAPAFEMALRACASSERVRWHGQLGSPAIAALLATASGFVHPSAYETFSVVCAEALCSGVPVVHAGGGALPEVVGEDSVVVHGADWQSGLEQLAGSAFDSEQIARRAAARFGKAAVGKQYFQALQACFPSHTSTS